MSTTGSLGIARRLIASGGFWSTTLACASLIVLFRIGYVVRGGWRKARGWEYEWVAGSLASGHGYSFDRDTAWLGPYATSSEYLPTAWVEPLHTFIAAMCFGSFGEGGRLVLVLLNVIWLAATCLLVYLCARQLAGPRAAIVSGALFAALVLCRRDLLLYIGNMAFATFLFTLCVRFLLLALEHPAFHRTLTLGALIGVSNLTHAGSLPFGAVAGSLILFKMGVHRREAWMYAATVIIIPLALIFPWALKHYMTFDELVPVRAGFGLQLYMGNAGLAMAVLDRQSRNRIEPPWTASTARQAVDLIRNVQNERALRRHATGLAVAAAPPEYASYNEVQRDRYFASQAITFVRGNPHIALELIFWKGFDFFFGWGRLSSLLTVAAFGGLLLRLRDLRVLSVMLLVIAYALPYALSVPTYYRYRAPVESLLFILVGVFFASMFQRRGWTPIGSSLKRPGQSQAAWLFPWTGVKMGTVA